MFIKTKITIDSVAYYVCFDFAGEDVDIHWISRTPNGFNRVNGLSEELKNEIKTKLIHDS